MAEMPSLESLRTFVIYVWLIWIIVYWWGGVYVLVAFYESARQARTPLDTLLLLIIFIVGNLLLGTGSLILGESAPVMAWADNAPVVLVGASLALIGMMGSTILRYAMGRLWSAATALYDDHRIIDSGPWGIVRHPLYLLIFMMYLGTALAFMAWWEPILFILLIAVHLRKLLDEEKFLTNHLVGYPAYMQRVRWRLLPGVW